MPVSAERAKTLRSQEWLAFRAFILFRAANRCEGTPQHPGCRAANHEAHPKTGSRVVLTIAHMDHEETHMDPERCRALCQRCHNQWDMPHRQANAAMTRHMRRGQPDLFDERLDGERAGLEETS